MSHEKNKQTNKTKKEPTLSYGICPFAFLSSSLSAHTLSHCFRHRCWFPKPFLECSSSSHSQDASLNATFSGAFVLSQQLVLLPYGTWQYVLYLLMSSVRPEALFPSSLCTHQLEEPPAYGKHSINDLSECCFVPLILRIYCYLSVYRTLCLSCHALIHIASH